MLSDLCDQILKSFIISQIYPKQKSDFKRPRNFTKKLLFKLNSGHSRSYIKKNCQDFTIQFNELHRDHPRAWVISNTDSVGVKNEMNKNFDPYSIIHNNFNPPERNSKSKSNISPRHIEKIHMGDTFSLLKDEYLRILKYQIH